MPPRRRSAVRIRLNRRCGKNHETAPVNTLRPSTLVSSRPARQTREPRCARSFICLRGIESTITVGGNSAPSPNDPPPRMARAPTPAITCDAISLGIARPPAQRDRGAPCPVLDRLDLADRDRFDCFDRLDRFDRSKARASCARARSEASPMQAVARGAGMARLPRGAGRPRRVSMAVSASRGGRRDTLSRDNRAGAWLHDAPRRRHRGRETKQRHLVPADRAPLRRHCATLRGPLPQGFVVRCVPFFTRLAFVACLDVFTARRAATTFSARGAAFTGATFTGAAFTGATFTARAAFFRAWPSSLELFRSGRRQPRSARRGA